MYTKIRKSVFETNSSSTHSITIVNDGQLEEPGDHLIIDLNLEFGWEFETYYELYNKLGYILVGMAQNCEETIQKFEDLRKCQPQKYDMLVKVLDKHNLTIEIDVEDGIGYIDHQSGHVWEEAFTSEENLEDFLFNPDSFVRTGNDNV